MFVCVNTVKPRFKRKIRELNFVSLGVSLKWVFLLASFIEKPKVSMYSRVPITRHGMFIRHTPCIWPDTFTKRWDMMFNRIRTKRKRAVPFNWIMLFWSVSILRGVFPYEPLLVFGSCHSKWQLWLIFHPIHFQSCEPLLLFSTWHKRSGEPLRLFSTPLLIGTRE